MTSWRDRLVAIGVAGGALGACTLTKEVEPYYMNSAPDPCLQAPDPVRCSSDRAAGHCANVVDRCCGKPDSFICHANVCVDDFPYQSCCTEPDPTACAVAICESSAQLECDFDAATYGGLPDAATEDGGAGEQ